MNDQLSDAVAAAEAALVLDPTDLTRTAPGLAGVPRAYAGPLGLVQIHLPRGISVEKARAVGRAVRACFVEPGPWVPLRELPAGVLFELKTGDVGVKRAEPATEDDRVRVVYLKGGEDACASAGLLARVVEEPARLLLERIVRAWCDDEIGQIDGALIDEAETFLGLAATPDPLAV